MKKSFKKFVSAVLAASMALTSVMVVNTASVTASEAAVGTTTTVLATDIKTAHSANLGKDVDLGSGVYTYMAATVTSTYNWKTSKSGYTFEDGTTVYDAFQIGKGNESISASGAVGDVITSPEKALRVVAPSAGSIKLYATSGSTGVYEGALYLVDASTLKIVATGSVSSADSGKTWTAPEFTIPAAGEYYIVQPAKEVSTNVAGFKVTYNSTTADTSSSSTTTTTSSSSTTTTTSSSSTTTTTSSSSTTTTVSSSSTTDASTDPVAPAQTVQATVNVDKTEVNAGDTVKATVDLTNNQGFNNYTVFVEFDPAVLTPKAAIDSTYVKTVGGVDYKACDTAALEAQFTNTPESTNADFNTEGTKTQAQLGKVKYAYNVPAQLVSEDNALQEFTGDGTLFGIEFTAVAEGSSDIKVTFVGDQLTTVSKDTTIAKKTDVATTAASVKVTGNTEPSTEGGYKFVLDADSTLSGATSVAAGAKIAGEDGVITVNAGTPAALMIKAEGTPRTVEDSGYSYTNYLQADDDGNTALTGVEVLNNKDTAVSKANIAAVVTADKKVDVKIDGKISNNKVMAVVKGTLDESTNTLNVTDIVVREVNTTGSTIGKTLSFTLGAGETAYVLGVGTKASIFAVDWSLNTDKEAGADGQLGFKETEKAVSSNASEFTLTFGAIGIDTSASAFTGYIYYDSSLIEATGATGGAVATMIGNQITYVPAAANPDYQGDKGSKAADGTNATAKLGKIKIAYLFQNANGAEASIGDANADLATVSFKIVDQAALEALIDANGGSYTLPVQFVSVESDGTTVAYTSAGKLAVSAKDGSVTFTKSSTGGDDTSSSSSSSSSTTTTVAQDDSSSSSSTTTTTAQDESTQTTTRRSSGGGGGGGGGSAAKINSASGTTTTEAATEGVTSEKATEGTTNQIVVNDDGSISVITPNGTKVTVNPPTGKVVDNVNFTDLDGYEWAADYINKLAELGIVTGTDDGIYSPELGCKRGDFAILINRTLGLDVTPTKNFNDNAEGKYYYNDVRMGYTAGILSGYGDNNYKPEKYCNRDEMFVLVAKTLEYLGIDVTSTPTSVNNKYADVDDVAWWSAPYLAFLTQEGIVTGSANGNVEPKRNINRAEMAVMMYKDYEYVIDYVGQLKEEAAKMTVAETTTEETTVDESTTEGTTSEETTSDVSTETTTDTTETTTVAE